ncbi:MAG: phycobiliprotein lyase [Cyanobacteria bacterium P01_A01_bin.114]
MPLSPEHSSSEGTAEGTLLNRTPRQSTFKSRYSLENEVLTIATQDGTTHSQERWWFITDNLRMRTHILKDQDGSQVASFCSEIRMGGKPPANP